MRTISRILSKNCNPEGKIYLHNFGEKGGIYVSLIINLYFRTIVENCSRRIYKSHYTTYHKFILNYKGARNVALKSVVIILLSELPKEKRIKLINKHFNKTDYKVKQDIFNDSKKLDKLINKDKCCATARLYKFLRKYYVW